ncbi:glutamate receptor 2.7-like [Tripterygium wilfordii]|uniref:glutamate receptor 2.7-like n=1 Tax=Tripterygium wilfordii TaxID=458696 RepID=UPI0018F808BA|nr:glutamate receptor 2.7-like [Tripterygium wilfordii]
MWKDLPFKLAFSSSSSSSSFLIFSIWVLLFTTMGLAQNNATIPVKIGVVVDLETEFGMMSLSCINMALSDFYSSHSNYKTRLVLTSRDSNGDVVGAASAGLDLIKNGQVQAILGPETSMEANFLIKLGDKSQVPIVTFSASSASLTSFHTQYFVRATQNDSSQVLAISALVQAYQWQEAVLVYVDDEYGQGIIQFLTDALQAVNTRVSYRSVISSRASSDEIEAELYMLMTKQTRVFIVHMSPSLGSRVFTTAKRIGMMREGFVWIMTDSMTNLLSSLNNSVVDSMQGLLGVRPYVPITKELEEFQARWKRKFQQDNPTVVGVELNVFGLRAYDAVVALAMAAENAVNSTNSLIFQNPKNGSANSTTDLDSIGISQNGPSFLQALLKTTFKGLSGEFRLIDRQLQSSTFQIVNINGNGARGVGYWTPDNGLERNLNDSSGNSTIHSTSNSTILGTIIWPGDLRSTPKGWEIPTNEPKMRIAVPVKQGFTQFVKVTTDSSNTITITGYCIDVFDAVIKSLPYAVPYELIPYSGPNGEQPNYDEMIYQVFLGRFDGVVGDTTIRANRSNYVDFTLPYTESGVSMIVPFKENKSNNAWVFLKPLTWDLWATSGCFFVFIGFVVWVLEHRINEDFRGPPAYQAGTSFWFSFSTMVFAHRERVVSNLARFVVIIWCFVVLILTQSYTASLTSLLTVQQLQPTVNDVHELIKNQENIGYQMGTFVYELLIGLGFDKSKLVVYQSAEECHDLFEKGTAKGGIAAAFDEVPYLRIFLAKYCSKYTMVDPTFKTAGFGFVFPRNSPLVPDVSRAILEVTEGDKMKDIEKTWFGNESTCPNSSTSVSSSSLGLDSFWGLFLIAGVASTLALLIFAAMFVYEQRNLLKTSDSESSKWRKIWDLARIFNQKDLTSHTFKKSKLYEESGIHGDDQSPVGTSPSTHCYPSPSSYDHSFTFFGEQGTPSPEHGDPNNPNVQVTEEIDVIIELANHTREQQRIPEDNP